MERIELGRSGIRVSQIGLGMWQAGGSQWGADVNDGDCAAAMARAIQLGVNLIDTAEVYGQGHSEEVVGRAIQDVGRENVVVATKVAGQHLRPDDVVRACKGSLKRLGIREIDVYQIHWPDPWEQVPLSRTMRALERLHKDGSIRAIGVSNFAVRDLDEARSHLSVVDIASNQVRYNLLHREIEAEVLPYCKREKITTLAYSPLAQGVLTGRYGPENAPTDAVRKQSRFFREDNLKEAEHLLVILRRIATAHRRTAAQVALNWLNRDPIVVPIPGAKRPAQAEENAGAAGWRLSEDEVREIETASARLHLDLF